MRAHHRGIYCLLILSLLSFISSARAAISTQLIYLQTPIGAVTYSQHLYVCNYCSTLNSAESYVLSYAEENHLVGTHSIEVINANSASSWFILYEYYPADYPKPIVDEAAQGTPADNELLTAVIMPSAPPIVIHIGSGSPYPNLTTLSVWGQGSNEADIWNLLDTAWGVNEAQLYAVQADANMMFSSQGTGDSDLAEVLGYIYDAVSLYLGKCPIEGTVVFGDGSVGQFCFSIWDTNKVNFVKGSGRTANGAFYSINGDSSNGSGYVSPMNGGYLLTVGSTTLITCYDYYTDGTFEYTTCPKSQ